MSAICWSFRDWSHGSRCRSPSTPSPTSRTLSPDLRLDIVGDGPELGALQAQATRSPAADRIAFHGRKEAFDWYSRGDCLIHPSATEGFGRVVAEAQASGLPVIGPRAGALGELIIDGQNGFTFERGSARSCEHALRRLLALSPDERRAMSARAIGGARRLFDIASIADAYVSVASGLLDPSRG